MKRLPANWLDWPVRRRFGTRMGIVAGIKFDTKNLTGGLAAVLGGIALACTVHDPEPPGRMLDSPDVQSAAARAMVNIWIDARPAGRERRRGLTVGSVNGEYADASPFRWNADWIEAMKQEIASPQDLDFEGWIKHDRGSCSIGPCSAA